MGYEMKMYVVERTNMNSKTVLIDGMVHIVFSQTNNGVTTNFYYRDRNTRGKLPHNATVKEGRWMKILGMVDLCKCGNFYIKDSICKFENSDGSHMYSENGNDYIGLDDYGDYRRFVPIKEVIDKMEVANKESPYIRYDMALALLKAVQNSYHSAIDVGCVFFGH